MMCSHRRTPESRHHTSSDVLHILKILKVNFGYSNQRRVAVIKPAVNNNLYK